MQQNELPSEVILEVPSGSEFDQSRPDLPPVAIYQLEPVIMPLNKNVLVLETDLDNKLTEQITAPALEPKADVFGGSLNVVTGEPPSKQGQLFQPQPNESRPVLPSIAKKLDTSSVISERLIENPSNLIINYSIDPIEFDKTVNPELDDFNPSLPTEPNIPILGANPVGDNVQNLSDK